MKIILQKDTKNVGKAGDKVSVKKGFARNFLIPKGLALPLNESRLKVWKHQKVIIEAKKRKAQGERKELIEKLKDISLNFEKEQQKSGQLFGSVTSFEISQALDKKGFSVDKKDISPSIFKQTGDHEVKITLDKESETTINIHIKGKVVKKKEEEKKEEEGVEESPLQASEEESSFESESVITEEEPKKVVAKQKEPAPKKPKKKKKEAKPVSQRTEAKKKEAPKKEDSEDKKSFFKNLFSKK